MRRIRVWVAVATTALAAAACGSGASSSSGSAVSGGGRPPAVVTQAEALSVFTTYIQAPVATQVNTETGPLQLIDQAGMKLSGAAGGASPPASANPAPPASDLSVFVPYQRSYPAVFVAERSFHPTAGPSAGKTVQELWVFRRDAAAGSWAAVAQASGGPSGPLPRLAQDGDGYISVVNAADAQQFAFDPATVPASLAEYLQSMHPSVDEFAPGPATTEARASDAQLAKDALAKNSLVAVAYHADLYPDRFAFRLASGGALELFALGRSEVFNDPMGRPNQLTVGADPTAVVGVNIVAPGTYSNIIYDYVDFVVAVDPPKSATAVMVTVLGNYTGIASAHGFR